MTELFDNIVSTDFLGFTFHTVNYEAQLRQAQTKTYYLCGVTCFDFGTHLTLQFAFGFFGGSLGCAESQKIVLAAYHCLDHHKNLVLKIASGGVRMQEGVAALHGMSICCASLSNLRKKQLVICILQDPCYGGASASFAREADIVFAEAGARIGFAGPEVVKNTIYGGDYAKFDKNVFDGFQAAETLLKLGQIDGVFAKDKIDGVISDIISFWQPSIYLIKSPEFDSGENCDFYEYTDCRSPRRPYPLDYLRNIAYLHTELAGDAGIRIYFAEIESVKCLLIFTHKSDFTDTLSGLGTPIGYRAAGNACALAGKMGIPVITLVDTSGALPSPEAELYDYSKALSQCLTQFAESAAFIVTIITGEGGSGGALAIAAANAVAALERSFYNVISPEGGVSILAPGVYKNNQQEMRAHFAEDCKILANAQKCYPKYLHSLGVVDCVIKGFIDNESGANCTQTSYQIKQYIMRQFTNFGIQTQKNWRELRRQRNLQILHFSVAESKYHALELARVPLAEKARICKPTAEITPDQQKLLRFLAEKSVEHAALNQAFPSLETAEMRAIESETDLTQYGDLLRSGGPAAVLEKLAKSSEFCVTDTSFRDAHQSILATRLRTRELMRAAELLTKTGLLTATDRVFSIECWGGATFDTCLRFLQEDPFERLKELKRAFPHHLTQMLLRGKNAVGYTSYPDNVIKRFIVQAAETGMDVFRVFDAFNDLDQMSLCVDTVLNETAKLCEICVCFGGIDSKFTESYYLDIIDAIKVRWPQIHLICLKDMAGLLKPADAKQFFTKFVYRAHPIPVHYHTHDTSGVQSAVIEKAVLAGVKIVDLATNALAGLSSYPPLQSILYSSLSADINYNMSIYNSFFYRLRENYRLFEKALTAPSADVYAHQMPGGQISNLYYQCIAMGLGERWEECMQKYAEANAFFGGIIKVTPSSKVVGDLALFMLQNDLSAADVAEINDLPTSVVKMLEGDLGRPFYGFPADLQCKFKFKEQIRKADADFEVLREQVTKFYSCPSALDLTTYALYPDVFKQYILHKYQNGPLHLLHVRHFFYGLKIGETAHIPDAEITLTRIRPAEFDHSRKVDFYFNKANITVALPAPAKDDAQLIMAGGNASEVECGVLGIVQQIVKQPGTRVKAGDALFKIVSSKLEIVVSAKYPGILREIAVKEGQKVVPGCLLGKVE